VLGPSRPRYLVGSGSSTKRPLGSQVARPGQLAAVVGRAAAGLSAVSCADAVIAQMVARGVLPRIAVNLGGSRTSRRRRCVMRRWWCGIPKRSKRRRHERPGEHVSLAVQPAATPSTPAAPSSGAPLTGVTIVRQQMQQHRYTESWAVPRDQGFHLYRPTLLHRSQVTFSTAVLAATLSRLIDPPRICPAAAGSRWTGTPSPDHTPPRRLAGASTPAPSA
jgi:hypothetical protein